MESLVDLELTFYFPPNYWFQIFVRLFSFICIAMYVQNYLNYGIKHLTFRDTSTLTTITKAVLYTCSFKRMVLNNLKLSKLCYVSVVFFKTPAVARQSFYSFVTFINYELLNFKFWLKTSLVEGPSNFIGNGGGGRGGTRRIFF